MTDLFEQQVLPLFEEYRGDWLEQARLAAIRLSKGGRIISADDVREVCPPPEEVDPRVMGGVFKPREEWEPIGYVKSERRINHGRPVMQWRYRGGGQ